MSKNIPTGARHSWKLMMTIKSTKLLTLDEAASFLGVSKISLRRWTNDGLLACHRIGPQGRRRFDLEQLKKFAEQRNTGPRLESETRYPLHRLSSKLEPEPRPHICASSWSMISGVPNSGRSSADISSTTIAAASRPCIYAALHRKRA